jgi:DNA-directed RNA polymerase specialized sigma24 family protein
MPVPRKEQIEVPTSTEEFPLYELVEAYYEKLTYDKVGNGIRELAVLQAAINKLLDETVIKDLELGLSYRNIGEALQVSPQAVNTKYRNRVTRLSRTWQP